MSEEDTVELAKERSFADSFFAPRQHPYQVRVAGDSHTGRVRKQNEDHFAVIRRLRTSEVVCSNLPSESLGFTGDESYGMIVADGVGGASHGEVASRIAIEKLLALAAEASSWVMRVNEVDKDDMRKRVNAFVAEIQAALTEEAGKKFELHDMATTWTSAYLVPPHAFIINIGDSRAYVHRGDQMVQITRDHTLAQDMIESGIPASNVREFAHLLTRSLGGSPRDVHADLFHVTMLPGDRLVLCTDGLSDCVRHSDMIQLLNESDNRDPRQAVKSLIEAALDGGGKDNVTVVVCDVDSRHPLGTRT